MTRKRLFFHMSAGLSVAAMIASIAVWHARFAGFGVAFPPTASGQRFAGVVVLLSRIDFDSMVYAPNPLKPDRYWSVRAGIYPLLDYLKQLHDGMFDDPRGPDKICRTDFDLSLPTWVPILVTALLPVLWLVSTLRRRKVEGVCPNCGYDLRATRDRCPECGRPEMVAESANLL